MELVRISYEELNARQQEAYNYQKLSAVLAEFGLNTIRLSDDWQGADFIAQHCQTSEYIAVQLKGRFGLWKKYVGKSLWIAFHDGGSWFLYDHDRVLAELEKCDHGLFSSKSWMKTDGEYHFPSLTKVVRAILEPYRIRD